MFNNALCLITSLSSSLSLYCHGLRCICGYLVVCVSIACICVHTKYWQRRLATTLIEYSVEKLTVEAWATGVQRDRAKYDKSATLYLF